MSINWVMRQVDLNPPFVPLENESLRFASPEPVEVKLKPLQLTNPDVISIKGRIYLTSHRIVVLSSEDRATNDSFALLYKDIGSHKLEMPWFGTNKYKFLFKISDSNGGLNYLYTWESTVSFTNGGAIRFAEEFDKIKTNFDNDQVDELPAYSE